MRREHMQVWILILAHGILGTLLVSHFALLFRLIPRPLTIDTSIAHALHSHIFPDAVRLLLGFSCSGTALHRYWVTSVLFVFPGVCITDQGGDLPSMFRLQVDISILRAVFLDFLCRSLISPTSWLLGQLERCD